MLDQSPMTRRSTKGLLSAGEEYSLAVRWRDDGDLEARNALINAYRPLAISMSSKEAKRSSHDWNDLEQAAYIGLFRAAEGFDPDKGNRFSTYAHWWIRAAMQDAVQDMLNIVKAPNTGPAKRVRRYYNDAMRRIRIDIDRGRLDPGTDIRSEVARRLNVTADQMDEIFPAAMTGPVSLDAPTGDDEDGENVIMNSLTDGRSAHDDLEASETAATVSEMLAYGLGRLTEKQADIIRRRWLTEPRQTLDVIGADYGVSKERIRQIEVKAFERLKTILGDRLEALFAKP